MTSTSAPPSPVPSPSSPAASAEASSRRLVLIDFDGTFAARGIAPQAHAEAVTAARAGGHTVLLATGRAASIVHPEVAALFDGMVTAAGARIQLGTEVLRDEEFPAALGRRAVEVLLEAEVPFVLEAHEALYATAATAEQVRSRPRPSATELSAGVGGGPQDIADALRVPEEITAARFAKISLWSSPVPLEDLAERIGPEVGALPGAIMQQRSASGELHLAGIDKADGLHRACEHLGFERSATVAIGDGLNDLGMMRIAGTGVAIQGAPEPVLTAADTVVPGPAELGIITAFTRLGLI